MKSARIIGLDVVRVIAIMWVVIFHSSPILFPLKSLPGIGGFMAKLLSFTIPLGILGVELFFVLSGFLIGTILIKTFIKSPVYNLKEIKNFLIRRWFRTLPNYWLVLTVNILLYKYLRLVDFNFNPFWYYVFMQNLHTAHPLFFREAWSLAIEEWFYLTLPIVLLAIFSVFKSINKQRILLITFIVYAIFFLMQRVIFIDLANTSPLDFDLKVRGVVMYRLDAIAYGFFMAYLFYFHKEAVLKVRKKLLLVSVLGMFFVIFVYYKGNYMFYSTSVPYRFFVNTLLLTLIPVFFSMCIPYAWSVREIKSRPISFVITTISKISYSMYLVHCSLIFLPFWQFKVYTVQNCWPYYIAYWATVFAASWLLYTFFELPAMNLRQRFSKEDPTI